MADIPQSRTEEILYATINGEEYTGLPESRIEELLLELKEVIEEGGGGGGGTSTIAWKPTVAADGTISWIRTASETKPDDQNIKGPKGDTGETGAKGDTGETGSQGPKGDDGDPGLGIKLVSINQQGHLIITFDDDTTQDAGAIPGGGGAVDSVNGKTGAVTLDAEDVGALPDDTVIPSNTSDLTNDSGFITKAVNDLINYYLKSETYTKAEVNALIGAISTIHFEAVLTLPTENIQTNVIYLVPKSISQSDNIKDEYINLDGTTAGWEKIGETEIDLSNYVTTTALNTALADYVTSTSLATTLASYAQTSQLPGVATASTAGLVKPDGVTTTVDANGVLTAVGGGSTPYDGRKIRYTISSSNWSSSPNSDGYYTYSLTLTNPLTTNTSPNVYIAGSGDNVQPTATESTMFSYVKRCNLSSSTTLVLYATTKPTSTFYVYVGAEGGSSGEVYSTTETVIGTWKGQTLYRKIIEFGTLPNNGLKDVSTGLGRYAIKVVNTCVICRDSANVNIFLPFVSTVSGGAIINFRYDNNGGYLCAQIQTNFDATQYTECDVIMEYIKV